MLFHGFLEQLLRFVVKSHRAERVGPAAEAGRRAVRLLETNGSSGVCLHVVTGVRMVGLDLQRALVHVQNVTFC